jgi:hypothetical protein
MAHGEDHGWLPRFVAVGLVQSQKPEALLARIYSLSPQM